MHSLDQFVLSQHRSMKVLYGGAVSFLEGHIMPQEIEQMLAEEGGNEQKRNVSVASLQLKKHQRLAHFHAENLLRMQQQQEEAAARSSGTAPNSTLERRKERGRNLLQMDDSIRAYSSIISATKEYSRVSVGKTSVTDSWLEGPLQWPPR